VAVFVMPGSRRIPSNGLSSAASSLPEDIKHIEADEKRVSDLLRRQEYAALPVTQELLELCRKDILAARKMLATD
jgi:hypothetical protein